MPQERSYPGEADEKHWMEHVLDRLPRPRGSYARTDPDYVDRTDTRNLDIYYSLPPQSRNWFFSNLPPEERRALNRRLEAVASFRVTAPEELASKRAPETLKFELTTLNREVAEYFAKHPHKLHNLSPRQFEELIGAILKDMGCDIEFTKQTRDGGRDILAAFPSPVGQLLTIVECKRHRADRPVGLGIAERFLYVVEQKDRASCGLIATTSYFSPEVKALAQEKPYRLKLKDFEGVRDWIANYGKWVRDDQSALWIPNH